MSHKDVPEHYLSLRNRHKEFFEALDNLGKAAKKDSPLDEKTTHLIQLAAAAASRSEGAVHSHVRRAVEAGATSEEIYHALLILTTTIGFPHVAAALSWADDILLKK